MSLALANVDADVLDAGADLTVYVVGIARVARTLPEVPYDPAGAKLRA